MLKKETGVVLKSWKSGTSSKILAVLGSESGKIKLSAKGALKNESPFRGSLEPGSIIEAVYYFKEGREIYFLKEVSLLESISAGTPSLHTLAAKLAALELMDQICYPGDPDPRIWDLIAAYIHQHEAADPLVLFLAFEVKLLGALGALPEFDTCAECGSPIRDGYYDPSSGMTYCPSDKIGSGELIPVTEQITNLLIQAERIPFPELARLEMNDRTRKTFGLLLHWTYTYHVQGYRLPNSLKLLK